MGKGRTKRKRKAEKLVVNKQAHQARLEKLDKLKGARRLRPLWLRRSAADLGKG